MEINKVIKRILVTEKSTAARDASNKYFFEVDRKANKVEIAGAVEKLFKVKVDSVQVVNVGGKRKRFGSSFGKRPDWKKAYVGLAEGHDINLMNLQ